MIPEKPITREEMYLNKIVTGSGPVPEKPITREEMYLDEISQSGGGGGGTIDLDSAPVEGSSNAVTSGGAYTAIEEARAEYEAVRASLGYARYGVTGIGQEASTLARVYDSIGMVAEVGTDGDNSNVRNDFDTALPFARRKCVGHWEVENDRAKFIVAAYLGDENYTEDGSIGDYVAVECPRCYYSFDHDSGTLIISAHKYEGFRAFDIFCHEHNQEETIPYFYAPAYFLGMKDGHAVSLPGYDDEQGRYKALVDVAKTYDGDASDFAMISPVAWFFYEWALFTVEFATQNCQNIMRGCCNLRSVDNDSCTFVDSTHILTNNYHASRVAGEYVAITTAISHVSVNYKATHRVVGVVRCDENGDASASGTHQLIEVEDLGKGYFTYDTSTTYYLAGRPYPTGYCNSVSIPSGSPVSNSDGYHPCKYRWVENPWGNHYQTAHDLFNVREGTGDSGYYLEWYYCLKPWEYVPDSTTQPDVTALQGNEFVKLGVSTPHADYVDGYIKTKQYDNVYPDIWIPGATKGASGNTYYGDYAYLVNAIIVRSCRFCGAWSPGAAAGLSFLSAQNAPSVHSAPWSAALFFAQ